MKDEKGVKQDTELDADDMKELVGPLQGLLQGGEGRGLPHRIPRSS